MDVQGAPWPTVVAPALIVFGVVGLLPGVIPMQKRWARILVVGAICLAMARYLTWRLGETLILDGWGAPWSLFCLAVELLAMWDGTLLFLAFLKTSDRRAEADRGEAAARAAAAGAAPKVDVLIPTYDEPLGVLEKTIVGALSLDWPNLAIYVLDDGRRPWLRDFCEAKGVGYVTRPDNKGAKAGNVNHALKVTDGEFVAIFDADFVPQRRFLMRVMGFFDDPKVGIVQTPHAFYNHDPMQTNLGMRKSLPDDQRFFFESIMPSRDGWDAAFCCGSNSVTRRAALDAAGGALPDGSITEDMLLSLVLLRKGFITRFLGERLAYGLAPETVSAFFVQRQRWARGAIQIMFLRAGPFGPGLRMAHRLLFLPTHWLTHSLMTLVSLIVPVVFLLTGMPPMQHTSLEAAVHYLLPMLIAVFGGLMAFAPGKYHPLAAQVLGAFQSFKLLPTILATLVRPHGHAFKVTPKGANAGGEYERTIFLACLALIGLTLAGLMINVIPEWRVVDDVALVPLVAMWCGVNLVVLFLVSLLCLQMPVRRQEERFDVAEPVILRRPETGALAMLISIDMSLSGAGLQTPEDGEEPWTPGDRIQAYVSSVGWMPARVARSAAGFVGIEFEHEGLIERDLLVRKLFTGGQNTAADTASTFQVTLGLLKRIWTADMRIRIAPAAAVAAPTPPPPEKLPAQTLVLAPSERATALADALERLDRAA
jgi:cellulose synthase/poly-beta-1,6-N-acetylglucosamine synthase-like glycosyltransferase